MENKKLHQTLILNSIKFPDPPTEGGNSGGSGQGGGNPK